MRFLVVTNPAVGHFYPMVPFLWALRAAAHDLLVCCPSGFHTEVRDAGLPVFPSSPEFDMVEAMRPPTAKGPPRQASDPSQARVQTGEGFARLANLTFAGVIDAAKSWLPDAIVGESSAYSAGIAAESAGIPLIEFSWGLPLLPEIKEAAIRMLHTSNLRIAQPWKRIGVCPPSFLLKSDEKLDYSMRYVPYNGASVFNQKILNSVRNGSSRPKILVTLGTVLPHYGDIRAMLAETVQSLLDQNLEVVVAMRESDKTRLGDLSTLPRPITEASWISIGSVLGAYDAIVHHGGSGTSMTSLTFGIPQIVIPQFADQFNNANHVQLNQCGMALDANATGHQIADATMQVLQNTEYGRNCKAISLNCEEQLLPKEMATILVDELLRGEI